MKSLNLNVRVDTHDKKEFEQFGNRIGMNASTVVNMFIKEVLRKQKLPFEIRTDTFDEIVYEKLEEAELEMTSNTQRYSKEEVLKSMNDIIG